jgi:hypothetical protein
LSDDELSDLTIIKPVQTKSTDWDDLNDYSDDDSDLPMKTVITDTNMTATPSTFSPRCPDTVDFGTRGVVDETSFDTARSSHRQMGVSMKYISPDGTVHNHQTSNRSFCARNVKGRTPRGLSFDIESPVAPDPPQEKKITNKQSVRDWAAEYYYDENFLIKNGTEATDDEEEWNTNTITIGNSASTSAILAVASDILNRDRGEKNSSTTRISHSKQLDFSMDSSIGSSVAPPPSESLITKDSPVVNRKTPGSVRKKFVKRSPELSSGKKTPQNERSTPRTAPNSSSTESSSLGRRTLNFNSPDSEENWAPFKIHTPLVYTDSPDAAAEQRWLSPTPNSHQVSTTVAPTMFYDRTEYLKNRRRELEERFNQYKKRISENLSSMSNETSSNPTPKSEPNPAMPPENGIGGEKFNAFDDGRVHIPIASPRGEEESQYRRSTTRCTPKVFDKSEDNSEDPCRDDLKQRRQRSRTPRPKVLRSRKDYASLNDIEQMLDADQEWKMDSIEESKRLDALVVLCARRAEKELYSYKEIPADQMSAVHTTSVHSEGPRKETFSQADISTVSVTLASASRLESSVSEQPMKQIEPWIYRRAPTDTVQL